MSSSREIFINLIRAAQISIPPALVDRCVEISRRLASLPSSDTVRNCMAVELACRASKTWFEHSKLLTACCIVSTTQRNDYRRALTLGKALVGLQLEVSEVKDKLRMMCSEEVLASASELLLVYRAHLEGLSDWQRKSKPPADHPLVICALHHLAAEEHRVVLDRDRLCDISDAEGDLMRKAIEDVRQVLLPTHLPLLPYLLTPPCRCAYLMARLPEHPSAVHQEVGHGGQCTRKSHSCSPLQRQRRGGSKRLHLVHH